MQLTNHIKERARTVAAVALGLVISASLLGAGLASAGIPAQTPSSAGAPASITSASKLYGQLDAKVKNAAPDTTLRVIVHLKQQADLSTWPAKDRAGAIRTLQNVAAQRQPQVVNSAQSSPGVNVYQRYWIFNGFAMEAPAAVIQAIAQRDDVDYVVEDGYMTLPKDEQAAASPDDPTSNWNIYQVNAPQTWALGYDGTGRTVANQDSGVDGAHQALATRWRGVNGGNPANSWLDPFGISTNFPTATGSHGTHTMGTIAGYFGDNTGPNEIGQAKGATWIACRIYDTSGKGPFSYIHQCFQFMADPDGNPNTNDQPDAVNNSWGDSNSYLYPDLEWWPDVMAWRAVGVIPVFSNGNNGPGASTVGKPGGYPIAIGTGAIDINHVIAGFSSRGPSPNLPPWNNPDYWERSDWNLIKPDVVAPGVNVRSSLPGNTYGNNNGTSMAAPHVTGMAGIMRQIRPDLTINEFYNIIIDTAYWQASWGTRPNNNYGWGEIDDYAAAVYIRDAGAVMGTITDGSCDIPVIGADVRVIGTCTDDPSGNCGIRKMVSDNDGDYRTILAAGSYTVTVSAPGYYGASFNTSVLSTTTNTLPIVLMKMPSGAVTGTVTDGTNPLEGAIVSIDGLPNVSTITNASGQYTLNNVPAGTFTVRGALCGYTDQTSTVTVNYPPSPVIANLTLTPPTVLLSNDFEDGTLNDWTVTGGSPATGIWHNSTLRGYNSAHAARAGLPTAPFSYTGAIDTYMTSAITYTTAAANQAFVSFDLYNSAESEYDITRFQLSTDGGTTWLTLFGQSGPRDDWQHICLDVTNWTSANVRIRFWFHTDGSNWNGETFEGPSIDNVRFTNSTTAVNTVVPAHTPTPGTQIPCTPVGTPVGATATATPTLAVTPTVCSISFSDVPVGSTFYEFVRCLACRGIINGYPDGTFKPNNLVTRGQLSKIVSNSAGFSDPATQMFEDVPPGSTFFDFIGRLASRGYIAGYPCGGAGEPCNPPGNLPYFRPNNNATRGQISKIVSNAAGFVDPVSGQSFQDVAIGSTFYEFIERLASRGVMSGYPCGGAGEPCVPPGNLPYFRPNNNATRGQTSKIVSNAFFPACQTP
jgi:hypothetical protein